MLDDHKPMQVVYNGFDFSDYNPMDPATKYEKVVKNKDRINILIAGTLIPGKGHKDALLAVCLLIKKGWNIKLSIVGTGEKSYLVYLKSLATELSISNNIIFHGFTQDIDVFYQKAAVTIVCSQNEAFGRVAVESLAWGTPVVATNSGGVREIIKNNITGFLYEPGDYNLLAEKIEELLINQEQYIKFAQEGQLSVLRKFTLENYIGKIQDIIIKQVKDE
jgi:glycosyltransferase involved in cell wall biosynthesis